LNSNGLTNVEGDSAASLNVEYNVEKKNHLKYNIYFSVELQLQFPQLFWGD